MGFRAGLDFMHASVGLKGEQHKKDNRPLTMMLHAHGSLYILVDVELLDTSIQHGKQLVHLDVCESHKTWQ